jgi:hypothetical protein
MTILHPELVREAVGNACNILLHSAEITTRQAAEAVVDQRLRFVSYGWPATIKRADVVEIVHDAIAAWLLERVRAAEHSSFPPDAPSTERPPPAWCERCDTCIDDLGCCCSANAIRALPPSPL